MRHLDLFAGIGGFSLAARWAGWETVAWCEINPFCQTVLKYHFPNATGYTDIKQFDGRQYAGRVDIISGGFPCQPFSSAGRRKGTADDRHLWPEMLRVIREVAPRWVVGENVRGITTWSDGLVFEQVQAGLEAAGYEVQSFVLPAASVNAPHERYRVWFVAYAGGLDSAISIQQRRQDAPKNINACGGCKVLDAPDPIRIGQPRQGRAFHASNKAADGQGETGGSFDVLGWPTESPVCGRNDGFPSGLAGITVSTHRRESLAAYGNAIVPQVAYRIFDTINQYEHEQF